MVFMIYETHVLIVCEAHLHVKHAKVGGLGHVSRIFDSPKSQTTMLKIRFLAATLVMLLAVCMHGYYSYIAMYINYQAHITHFI